MQWYTNVIFSYSNNHAEMSHHSVYSVGLNQKCKFSNSLNPTAAHSCTQLTWVLGVAHNMTCETGTHDWIECLLRPPSTCRHRRRKLLTQFFFVTLTIIPSTNWNVFSPVPSWILANSVFSKKRSKHLTNISVGQNFIWNCFLIKLFLFWLKKKEKKKEACDWYWQSCLDSEFCSPNVHRWQARNCHLLPRATIFTLIYNHSLKAKKTDFVSRMNIIIML